MDEVTQQNAALVEQAAAAAQSLEEQATRLKEAVSVFKVADTAQSAARVAAPRNNPRPTTSGVSVARRAQSSRTKVVSDTPSARPIATAADTANADWETF